MANSFFDIFLRFATTLFASNGKDKEIQIEIPIGTPKESETVTMSITKSELLKGRDQQYPLDYTQTISDNLDRLLIPLNNIRNAYGKPMIVDSGWRPPSINGSTPGAAPHSKHMLGLAADISDPDGELMNWVLANLQLMKDNNIFMEDFDYTPNWVHFQLTGPGSMKRIFVPNANPPISPGRWDKNYDEKYDG